jgi:signal transduction histidine kinase
LTERVLLNLLDNAVKFTPQGGKISVILTNKQHGVEVVVADTGIGIAKADQEIIFERYMQAASEEPAKKGTGLGLAIVKKILDLHQVKISLESTPGRGASFCFELPVFST